LSKIPASNESSESEKLKIDNHDIEHENTDDCLDKLKKKNKKNKVGRNGLWILALDSSPSR